MEFKKYQRKEVSELRPWVPGEDLSSVSLTLAQVTAGHPKPGDMIARDPSNHGDQWLIAAEYFEKTFQQEPVS